MPQTLLSPVIAHSEISHLSEICNQAETPAKLCLGGIIPDTVRVRLVRRPKQSHSQKHEAQSPKAGIYVSEISGLSAGGETVDEMGNEILRMREPGSIE